MHQQWPRKRQEEGKDITTKSPAGVLLRNLTERGGPGKLRSHWGDAIYVVQSQKGPDMPIYEIKPESGGKSCTVHRNLLLPCDSLPLENLEEKRQDKQKQMPRRNRGKTKCEVSLQDSDQESDEEGDLVWRLSHQHHRTGTVDAPAIWTEVVERQAAELHWRDNEPALQDGIGEGDGEPQSIQDGHDLQEHHQESDEVEHGDRDSGSEMNASPQALNVHPQRERHRPRMLTYDALGKPTVREAGMDSIEVGTPETCFQRLWRPWVPMG